MLVRTFTASLISNADMSSIITVPMFNVLSQVDLIHALFIQSIISGSPNGSMKLQTGISYNGSIIWNDIPYTNQLVVGTTNPPQWNLSDQGWLNLQIVYTPSSGSGLLTVLIAGKGN
jgi:hypothetical protein